LGALAKYNGGLATNFQQIAGELLAARPALASLELQPSGVVGAIVPWAGNERAIGANVFRDPPRRLGANAAIQKRALTVAGPLRLLSGEPGISVMAPIFQRGRDSRESSWGFVVASMRVSEALARAQVEDLGTKGYCYVLLAPAPAQQKSNVIGIGLSQFKHGSHQLHRLSPCRSNLQGMHTIVGYRAFRGVR
jgi:diguanylate cyclase